MLRTSAIIIFITFCLGCKKTVTPVKEPITDPVLPENVYSRYDGLFCSVKNYNGVAGNYTISSSQTYAYFSTQSIINEAYNAAKLADIGEVWVNNTRFKAKNGSVNFYYQDTSSAAYSIPFKWRISGSSKLDSFSYVNDKSYPTLNTMHFPDSIRLSRGLNLITGKTNNCTLIRLFLFSGNTSTYINKFNNGSDTLLSLTAEELKDFTPSGSSYLSLTFYNDNLWNINGKTINFRNSSALPSIPVRLVP